MSHVATIDVEIKDLDALDDAVKRLGGELIRGQQSYKWWGRHMGDYPLPAGYTAEELGTCEHAIKFPDAGYEIGVVKRRDGRPGWGLLWDFIDSSLVSKVGAEGKKLIQTYAVCVASRQAMRTGYRVHEQVLANGSVQLRLTK